MIILGIIFKTIKKMPQLDIFIFIPSGIYLFVGFFLLLAYIHLYIIPSLGSLIKLRKKLVSFNSKSNNEFSLNKIANWPVEKYLTK